MHGLDDHNIREQIGLPPREGGRTLGEIAEDYTDERILAAVGLAEQRGWKPRFAELSGIFGLGPRDEFLVRELKKRVARLERSGALKTERGVRPGRPGARKRSIKLYSCS